MPFFSDIIPVICFRPAVSAPSALGCSMRNRMKPLLAAAVGMIVSIGFLVTGSNQPASAAAPALLPISSYYQMVVDSTHGHIFISQGSSSQNGILVTVVSGPVNATITGTRGVVGNSV